MKRSKPLVSAHRLARLMQWAQIALLRAAYILASAGSVWAPLERRVEEKARAFLLKMTRAVFILIAAKAAMQLKPRRGVQSRAPNLAKPRGKRKIDRALFGARLRSLAQVRGSNRRDPRGKISALLALLANIDAHAARLAKRLAGGLCRRLGGFVREAGAALASRSIPPLAIIDTS